MDFDNHENNFYTLKSTWNWFTVVTTEIMINNRVVAE